MQILFGVRSCSGPKNGELAPHSPTTAHSRSARATHAMHDPVLVHMLRANIARMSTEADGRPRPRILISFPGSLTPHPRTAHIDKRKNMTWRISSALNTRPASIIDFKVLPQCSNKKKLQGVNTAQVSVFVARSPTHGPTTHTSVIPDDTLPMYHASTSLGICAIVSTQQAHGFQCLHT